ncbi:MAG: rod shape-determining protein MreC [Kiritimatiellae bacterium]|nr:rod shape-determining protein MreC [Kiritimatiellia bacterium]
MERKKKSKFTLAVVALALAVVYVCSRSAAIESIYPAQKTFHFLREKVFSRIKGAFKSASARAENEQLKRQVASLAVLVDEVQRLEAENARLRTLLEYKKASKVRYIVASVLSRGGGAVESGAFIRIDKGSISGVRKNAVVVLPEGLVGKIVSVSRHTAEVLLLPDSRLKVSCAVEVGRRRILGVLTGGTEDNLQLKHMSGAETSAPVGSRVVTSGLGGVFPAGYVVGDYTGDGFVRPRVDFSSIEDVLVRNEE